MERRKQNLEDMDRPLASEVCGGENVGQVDCGQKVVLAMMDKKLDKVLLWIEGDPLDQTKRGIDRRVHDLEVFKNAHDSAARGYWDVGTRLMIPLIVALIIAIAGMIWTLLRQIDIEHGRRPFRLAHPTHIIDVPDNANVRLFADTPTPTPKGAK